MSLTKFQIDLNGTAPLIMHSSQSVNPIDPGTKALNRALATFKKTKTDESFYEAARLEFLMAMHHDEDLGPYLPSISMLLSLVGAGAVVRKSPKVRDAVLIHELIGAPVIYKGPRDPEKLWEDSNFVHYAAVKVNRTSRIMRCRPIFRKWSATFTGFVDNSILEYDDLVEIAGYAGMKGMGDWRPRYGRFEAKMTRL